MKRRFTFFALLLLCSLGILLGSGCDKSREQVLASNQSLIDTLSDARIKEVMPELDSLCKSGYKDRLQATTDSILEVRRQKIKELLGQ
ncbi:MAG: hypothetical protein AAF990_04825 [Bacteroidota bacterium]